MILTKVVFPAPLGPNRPSISPRPSSSETPLRAGTWYPPRTLYFLTRFLMDRVVGTGEEAFASTVPPQMSRTW